MTTVTTEDVLKALDSLHEGFDEVVKASDSDLDEPEGADLGNPAKDKMSSEVKAVKKAEDEEEEESEEGEEGMEMDKSKCSVSKSELPEEVQTKIEVSDFLKSLVDHNVGGLNKLADFIAKSDAAQETRVSDLSDAVESIAKSQAKIGIVLKALCEKMGVIENSPVRKSAKAETVAKSEVAAERSFASALESEKTEEVKMFKSLSTEPHLAKSQISNALCDLVMKGQASDMDVINFESAGFISPELVTKLQGII